MGKRIEYLDLLKFFAIFSVLVGHSTEQLSAGTFWDHPVWSFIYSYHMPLFMFLSGFFFRSSLNKPFKTVALNKLRQLGVPSLTAFALQCIIMLAAGVTAVSDLCELSFSGFMNSVWFLKCLLFCILIMYPLCKLFKNDFVAALAATLAITFIPGAEIVNLNFMLPMFCLGMLCGSHMDSVERHHNALLIASAALFFILLFFWSGRLTVYMVPTKVLAGGVVDWHNLGITAYRLLIGMAGSMMFFLLARPVWNFMKDRKISALLCRIGGATLGIYVLQTFVLEMLVNSLGIYVPIPWSYIVAPVLAVAELALCYRLVLIIRRNKVSSFLFLGDRLSTSPSPSPRA